MSDRSTENDWEPCDVCGAPSCIVDGIVNAFLCDQVACLDAAYDLAFPPVKEGDQ